METLKTEKILVIQTAFIGDAVLTLPLIQKLRDKYPESLIDVVSTPVSKEIFESSPCTNKVYAFDKRKSQKSILETIKFGKFLSKNSYSKIYSPHRSFRSSLLSFFVSCNESCAFDNSSGSFLYKNKKKYHKEFHEVRRNLVLIDEAANDSDWKILPLINASDLLKREVDKFIDLNGLSGKNIIAVAPGTVWETKKYPTEYFIEICKVFVRKGFEILLFGGSVDCKICSEIMSEVKTNIVNACGAFSIVGSIELLKHCNLLICNDSAPTHFSLCANIPVITVYCSTVPDFGFYPYHDKGAYVSYSELDCKPCGIHGFNVCPEKHFNCGRLLKPEIIIKKAEEMIGKYSK